ncbi:MAG TPA: TlpA disulfide reductase family protein [Terriglobales bacterium]|nr:TlpA disulfide reductase family protein [Terriglobales bacterium]
MAPIRTTPATLLLTALALALLLLSLGCMKGPRPAFIGEKAPDFTVNDGVRSVSLSAYRGKVVVLNFWATWCPPCVDEMPSLVALQRRLKDRVVVLAVSVDVDENAYNKFLRDYNIDLLTVRDPEQHSVRQYRTTGFPETFIIDEQGVVRRKFVGPVVWTSPEIVSYLEKLSGAETRTASLPN